MEVDRESHSYLLGYCEVVRDKYKAALERIAALSEKDAIKYAPGIARAALKS